MEQVIQELPRSYPEGLVVRYMNLVSEYISINHDGYYYRSRELDNRRMDLERELWQTGKHLERSQKQPKEIPIHYFVRYNRTMYRIDLSMTLYVYTYHRKVTFVQEDGSRYETYTKFGDIWEDIRSMCPRFHRISQRHIVNFKYVNVFSGRNVHIGGQVLHITAKYHLDVSGKSICSTGKELQ